MLASVLFSGCAMASTQNPPSATEVVSLLSNRQYSELDRRLSLAQQAYDRGAINDEQLREVFRSFYFTDPSFAPNFDEWVAQFPRSYVAHLARGIYYKHVGAEARGPASASETSREQFDAMGRALAKASADLELSLSLDPKPVLTYLQQVTIDQFLGPTEEGRKILDQSIALDPKSYVVRFAYMSELRPRWGGSLEQMRAFLEECRAAHLSGAQLDSLQATIAEEEALNLRDVASDEIPPVLVVMVPLLDPLNACSTCGPIDRAAEALRRERKYQQAIDLYSEVLEKNPKAINALDARADTEVRAGMQKAAFADFSRGARLGSAYAQGMLGRIYLVGTLVPHDRKAAIKWLSKAAAQGDQASRKLLVAAQRGNVEMMLQPGGPLL
jgi:tetratricopeptide (TPR) repeat protein